jgi:hypothetical protein
MLVFLFCDLACFEIVVCEAPYLTVPLLLWSYFSVIPSEIPKTFNSWKSSLFTLTVIFLAFWSRISTF